MDKNKSIIMAVAASVVLVGGIFVYIYSQDNEESAQS